MHWFQCFPVRPSSGHHFRELPKKSFERKIIIDVSVDKVEKLSQNPLESDKMNEGANESNDGHRTDSDNANDIEDGASITFGGKTMNTRTLQRVFSPAASVGNTEINAAAMMVEMVGERDSFSPGDAEPFNINQYLETLGTGDNCRTEANNNDSESVDGESTLPESTTLPVSFEDDNEPATEDKLEKRQ
jgi:hypothetical protein